MSPPTNPSTVFLGLSLKRGVFPHVIPVRRKEGEVSPEPRHTVGDARTYHRGRPRRRCRRRGTRGRRTRSCPEPGQAMRTASAGGCTREGGPRCGRTSRMLLTMKWLETTMTSRLMCTQQKSANCWGRYGFWRLETNPTNPSGKGGEGRGEEKKTSVSARTEVSIGEGETDR